MKGDVFRIYAVSLLFNWIQLLVMPRRTGLRKTSVFLFRIIVTSSCFSFLFCFFSLNLSF